MITCLCGISLTKRISSSKLSRALQSLIYFFRSRFCKTDAFFSGSGLPTISRCCHALVHFCRCISSGTRPVNRSGKLRAPTWPRVCVKRKKNVRIIIGIRMYTESAEFRNQAHGAPHGRCSITMLTTCKSEGYIRRRWYFLTGCYTSYIHSSRIYIHRSDLSSLKTIGAAVRIRFFYQL